MSKLLQNSGTCLPQLMNTSGCEGNKSLNAMSPDPFLGVAFGKRSGWVSGGSRKEGHDNLVSVIWRYLDQQFYNDLRVQASRIK